MTYVLSSYKKLVRGEEVKGNTHADYGARDGPVDSLAAGEGEGGEVRGRSRDVRICIPSSRLFEFDVETC
jgi:hypothetical protein